MPTNLRQAAGFLLGFWLALAWIGPLGTAGLANGAPDPPDGLEQELHRSVNALRTEQGRLALQRDAALDAVARAHSRDMATRGYFAHVSPDGENPVDRLEQAGIDGYTLAAENVGVTSRADANAEIVRGWIASKVHRDNLLAPVFNATGIGVHRAPDGSLYYTQLYLTFPRD